MWKNTYISYGAVTKLLHWLIFLLVLVMLIVGFCLPLVPEAYQGVGYNLHKVTGLTILTLMLIRLVWTLANPKPLLPIETPLWQRFLDHLVQWSLYIVLIAMPIAGWIGAVAGGRPPHVGELAISLPINADKEFAKSAFTVHNTIAFVIIALVTLHILAAAYHYFIKRDNIVQRMWPGT